MSLLTVDRVSKEFRLDWVRTSFIKWSEQKLREKSSQGFRKALDDVSFEVKEGERWGLIGTNGSGKTTLLKIIAGILRPTEGALQIAAPVTAVFSYNPGLADDLDMTENIYLFGTVLGMTRADVRRRFDEIVEFSGLSAYLRTRLRSLSEGMKARLFISMALHAQARLFIFDETISVLDRPFQEKCCEALMNLSKKGCGVIVTTHEETLLKRVAERSMLLEKGKIVTSGLTEAVLNQYRAIH